MLLKDQMAEQGRRLFCSRSYSPLVLLPLAVIALLESDDFERLFGRAAENGWEILSLCISLTGLAVRALTVGSVPAGTSGRSTKEQRARTLNTTGFYSIVRNPLYLGNFLVVLGFVMAIKVWWLFPIVGAAFALYYERIICAEEAFLEQKFGGRYTDWASRTPAFIPDPRLWCPPELPFSFRAALRREYHGFYLVVVAFTLIEVGHDILAEEEPLGAWLQANRFWVTFFGIGTLVYLILNALKVRTRVLKVAGR